MPPVNSALGNFRSRILFSVIVTRIIQAFNSSLPNRFSTFLWICVRFEVDLVPTNSKTGIRGFNKNKQTNDLHGENSQFFKIKPEVLFVMTKL